jgi:hypothetical protein
MRLWQYILARWILVVITGTALSMIASLILMGTSISYTLLIIGTVFSSCPAALFPFLKRKIQLK